MDLGLSCAVFLCWPKIAVNNATEQLSADSFNWCINQDTAHHLSLGNGNCFIILAYYLGGKTIRDW